VSRTHAAPKRASAGRAAARIKTDVSLIEDLDVMGHETAPSSHREDSAVSSSSFGGTSVGRVVGSSGGAGCVTRSLGRTPSIRAEAEASGGRWGGGEAVASFNTGFCGKHRDRFIRLDENCSYFHRSRGLEANGVGARHE
jgi:hypothetical protein